MRDFCLDLRKHAIKMINYKKKERNNTTNKKRRKKTIIIKKFVVYVEKDLVLMVAIKIPKSKRSLSLYWKI